LTKGKVIPVVPLFMFYERVTIFWPSKTGTLFEKLYRAVIT